MAAPTVTQLKRIAEGREAEIFEWEPGVVLKLYRSDAWLASREIERAAMDAVKRAGGPTPAATGTVEVDGRPGLLMERIQGVDLLTELGTQPWKIVRTGGVMGRVHAALNATPAPDSLPRLNARLARQIESLPDVAEELRTRGLNALARLPDGDRLCHGDFHPANIMLSPAGPVVIDWPNATRGDPAADVARTVLMIRLGELPPGSPSLLRKLDKVGRGFLRWRYPASYRRARPIDMKLVERWIVPVAIARLTEGIVEEHPKIFKLLGARDPR